MASGTKDSILRNPSSSNFKSLTHIVLFPFSSVGFHSFTVLFNHRSFFKNRSLLGDPKNAEASSWSFAGTVIFNLPKGPTT